MCLIFFFYHLWKKEYKNSKRGILLFNKKNVRIILRWEPFLSVSWRLINFNLFTFSSQFHKTFKNPYAFNSFHIKQWTVIGLQKSRDILLVTRIVPSVNLIGKNIYYVYIYIYIKTNIRKLIFNIVWNIHKTLFLFL